MSSEHSKIRIGNLYLFCFLLLITGCRTARDTTNASSGSLKAEEEYFDALRSQSFHYQTFSSRLQFSLLLESGKEVSSRGQIKIEKDKRLQISIQPMLGIEMFRIELTPDSIKLVDRMNKRYLVEDYKELKNNSEVDFNFHNLQALFTNQLFLPGETSMPKNAFKRFRWEQTPKGYVLQTKDNMGISYLFLADHEEKLNAAKITDNTDYTLQWDYNDFRIVDQQYFPMKMNGVLSTKNANNSIALNYSKVEVNTPLNMQFTIPSGYKRMTFSQIMKLFD